MESPPSRTRHKRDVIIVRIEETRDFGKGYKCNCADGIEVVGHSPVKKWSYPDAFGHHVEIESELPEVRCKNCPDGTVAYPEKVPWEDKGKPLTRNFSASPTLPIDYALWLLNPSHAYLNRGDGSNRRRLSRHLVFQPGLARRI